jgi:flagella basal body P-ring formation protein FlgA
MTATSDFCQRPAMKILPSMLAATAAIAMTTARADMEPHARIVGAAEELLRANADSAGARIEVAVTPLDSRLALPACGSAPTAALSPGARAIGRSSVAVSCLAPQSWTIHVAADVHVFRPVAIAARALVRGTLLTDADMTMREEDISRLPQGFLSAPEEGVGLQLRSPVSAGAVLTRSTLESPLVVRRGDVVSVVARTGPIEVSAQAEAMANGRMGDRIPLRNRSNGKMLQATVLAAGYAETSPSPPGNGPSSTHGH